MDLKFNSIVQQTLLLFPKFDQNLVLQCFLILFKKLTFHLIFLLVKQVLARAAKYSLYSVVKYFLKSTQFLFI